jgi:hypothetical protein
VSHSRSEQMVVQEDIRVEFCVVSVEENSTRLPTRSRDRRSGIRLVGDLVAVVRVALMDYSDWRVWERALVGVIEHQHHSHLLSMSTRLSLGIDLV